MVTNCFWLLKKILNFTSSKIKDPVLFSDSSRQHMPLQLDNNQLPSRRTDVKSTYSSVVGKELICGKDSSFKIWGTKGYLQVRGRNCRLPGHTAIDLGMGLNSTGETSITRVSKSTENNNDDSVGNRYLGLFYGDDLDLPVLVASHWLLPVMIFICGLVLLFSFWRSSQKRGRRRKGSGSGRSTNP